MQYSYSDGDVIRVYETPDQRARAEFGQPGGPGRPATVTRKMPDGEHQEWRAGVAVTVTDPSNTYEVSFTDGGVPSSAIVTPEDMLPAATVPAALAASAAQTMARAAEVQAEAQRLAAEAQRLAEVAQAAAGNGE